MIVSEPTMTSAVLSVDAIASLPSGSIEHRGPTFPLSTDTFAAGVVADGFTARDGRAFYPPVPVGRLTLGVSSVGNYLLKAAHADLERLVEWLAIQPTTQLWPTAQQ